MNTTNIFTLSRAYIASDIYIFLNSNFASWLVSKDSKRDLASNGHRFVEPCLNSKKTQLKYASKLKSESKCGESFSKIMYFLNFQLYMGNLPMYQQKFTQVTFLEQRTPSRSLLGRFSQIWLETKYELIITLHTQNQVQKSGYFQLFFSHF